MRRTRGLDRCLSCARAQYGAVEGAAITGGLRASRFLHRRADRYIAISTSGRGGRNRAGRADPRWCHHGGSHAAERPVGRGRRYTAAWFPPRRRRLRVVGALGPHKGVDVLLEACRRMRHRVPLVLVGTPRRDTPSIEEDAGVIVARNVPNAEVMAAWKGCSVAVVPSVWHEPMGQVAVEAMLVGRPVSRRRRSAAAWPAAPWSASPAVRSAGRRWRGAARRGGGRVRSEDPFGEELADRVQQVVFADAGAGVVGCGGGVAGVGRVVRAGVVDVGHVRAAAVVAAGGAGDPAHAAAALTAAHPGAQHIGTAGGGVVAGAVVVAAAGVLGADGLRGVPGGAGDDRGMARFG